MNRIIIKENERGIKISRHIYGHFSEHLGRCIYGGYWVDNDPDLKEAVANTNGIRNDVVEALKQIHIPNLRWPGGCFADDYHFRDGIGAKEERPYTINNHWGGVVEDNSFGTHEFLELCRQLECEPYICANVGSGTVQELSQWVEYCNFDGVSTMTSLRKKNGRSLPWKVRFWGIGNENWGCGGNMSPQFYADNYRRYACYTRNYKDTKIYKIACGACDFNYEWTRVLMEKAAPYMDGLSLHYYTVPGEWAHKGSATDFGEEQWFLSMKKASRIEELLCEHSRIMDEFDPEVRVGLVVDEWGIWLDVEPGTNPGFLYQQNSLRDALVAAIYLNSFNNHAERVFMANIAQTVNVLQSLILTEGASMLLTPTYHVFDMYKVHQDALKLPVIVESGELEGAPLLSASASKDGEGRIHISISTIDMKNEQDLSIELQGLTLSSSVKLSAQILSAQSITAHNTFGRPDTVTLKDFSEASINGGLITLRLPTMSIVTLELGRASHAALPPAP